MEAREIAPRPPWPAPPPGWLLLDQVAEVLGVPVGKAWHLIAKGPLRGSYFVSGLAVAEEDLAEFVADQRRWWRGAP